MLMGACAQDNTSVLVTTEISADRRMTVEGERPSYAALGMQHPNDRASIFAKRERSISLSDHPSALPKPARPMHASVEPQDFMDQTALR
jgi:hypothetical protein